jgi:hypothetical protein
MSQLATAAVAVELLRLGILTGTVTFLPSTTPLSPPLRSKTVPSNRPMAFNLPLRLTKRRRVRSPSNLGLPFRYSAATGTTVVFLGIACGAAESWDLSADDDGNNNSDETIAAATSMVRAFALIMTYPLEIVRRLGASAARPATTNMTYFHPCKASVHPSQDPPSTRGHGPYASRDEDCEERTSQK